MSFRKKNLVINRGPPGTSTVPGIPPTIPPILKGPPPGAQPSPINGKYTTSTGTPSLDSLLAGHAGLPLGCSLLIEEPGTTDFGGALLRYYAAEGIVQGHAITVIGFGENWVRDLPAVVGDAEKTDSESGGKLKEGERMKIAWRYERLGEFGSGIGGSRAQSFTRRDPKEARNPDTSTVPHAFCHSFDLTKRLTIPPAAEISFIPSPSQSLSSPAAETSPFVPILTFLTNIINQHPPTILHRIIIPSLLSPLIYPPSASSPRHLLPFLHSLRALLRRHSSNLTLMISLPLELYPRDTSLVRWVEVLSDGVLELTPLPQLQDVKGQDQAPQGLVKMWKLPVLGEKGGGVGGQSGEDLAFTVTRKRFEIKAYSLPPMDEEGGEHSEGAERGRATKIDIEF
ncbi:unnamed protein product [Tuber melanosporum]|uniref:Elongator complex protein 4 n=1 Tax=Tuber melanosporum (strain Mel28) TaxID=656061 RepID=D5G7Q1_TUBMM|nr:uncharacterized protein GSTUM_00004675001 [Tuber melanosporum]CAZ80544.1 unnamed protein product [Tuber melanosporum]